MVFTGAEKPLDAEQWLINTADLLRASQIPKENLVEIAKIQLKNVTKTWWLAEEARPDKPITWDQFSKVSMIDSSQSQLRTKWRNSSSDSSNGTIPNLSVSMPQSF